MSYIGNTNTTQAFTPAVDFFNGNGSTTAFTLSRPVASVAQVQAVISNVPQKPGDAFTVSGNTITFTSAPPSGTQNIYVYYTSPITQVIAPGHGTVGSDQLQSSINITTLSTTNGATVQGLTVGKGAGAVSTNTAVGASALASNTTGDGTAVGYQALSAQTTGSENSAFGSYSLTANTTGVANSAFGRSSLSSNTTGGYNTGIGRYALASNTTASNNTAVGYQSLYSNTTGQENTVVGFGAADANTTGREHVAMGNNALGANTTGSYNVAIGKDSLGSNTTAGLNTAVGYQAGYSNTTGTTNFYGGTQAGYTNTVGAGNVFLGYQAGYTSNVASDGYITAVGSNAGYSLTTGVRNSFFGTNAGYYVTSGSKNTVLGAYTGNQGGLDIRTSSNYIVLSDGDGNPRMICNNNGVFSNGAYGDGGSAYVWNVKTTGASGGFNWYLGATQLMWAYSGSSVAGGTNNADSILFLAKSSSTSRSLNAAGTLNASGADYAEYMTKAGNFTVAKGDVVGINPEGKLTNVFADAVSFVVKSTDPSYVGGDTWFTEQVPKDEANNPKQAGDAEYDAWVERLEAARTTVDRIAFAGQVPVNVTGATAGQYIIPVNDNGAIKGEAVSNPTFEQYQQAVGKVIAIEQDGRARIIVKVA